MSDIGEVEQNVKSEAEELKEQIKLRREQRGRPLFPTKSNISTPGSIAAEKYGVEEAVEQAKINQRLAREAKVMNTMPGAMENILKGVSPSEAFKKNK